MTVNAASGAKLFIGSTNVPVPGNFDPSDAGENAAALADFEADSYIEVGEIENLGEFGDESGSIPFTSLSDSRTRTFKGPRSAGTMPVVVGDDVTDEGQAAMVAAEAQKFDYNFKVVLNDALTLGGTGSESFFYGKVMSKRKNVGDANSVVKRNFAVAINSAIAEVPST